MNRKYMSVQVKEAITSLKKQIKTVKKREWKNLKSIQNQQSGTYLKRMNALSGTQQGLKDYGKQSGWLQNSFLG